MQGTLKILFLFFSMVISNTSFAQSSAFSKGEIPSAIKKQAKELRKQGWSSINPEEPIEDQLYILSLLDNEIDENGSKKYISATAVAKDLDEGNAITLANMQATAQISSLMQSKVSNTQSLSTVEKKLTFSQRQETETHSNANIAEPIVELHRTDGTYHEVRITRVAER